MLVQYMNSGIICYKLNKKTVILQIHDPPLMSSTNNSVAWVLDYLRHGYL